MNWEAVIAIGTVFTGLVILFTVITGYHQVRLTLDQLRQLRRASQLDAANTIFAELASPTFLEARRFILYELPGRLKESKFREEVELVGRADETVHQELIVLRTFERIGLYVEQELLDPTLIYHLASGRVVDTWEGLSEVVAIHRRVLSFLIWDHFEKLYERTLQFMTSEFGIDRAKLDRRLREIRRIPDAAVSAPDASSKSVRPG